MSEKNCTFATTCIIWFTMAKILVIDDERAIRNTLKEILEFEGYTVEVAENGRMGLEMALAAKYDLIYTDIKMPEMDGMELLQAYHKVMQEQGGEEAPVVMISGHGTVETAVDALKNGAYDFIVKPLDLNRLLVTTQRALEHKSLVQETKVLRKKIGARNKMVGESDRLCPLKMGVAGHNILTALTRLILNRLDKSKEQLAHGKASLAHIETEVKSDLVVTASCGVELLTRITDTLGKLCLHEHMDILCVFVKGERSAVKVVKYGYKSVGNLLKLRILKNTYGAKH